MMQLLGGYLLEIISLVSYSKQHFSFSNGKLAVQMDLLRSIESLEQCRDPAHEMFQCLANLS